MQARESPGLGETLGNGLLSSAQRLCLGIFDLGRSARRLGFIRPSFNRRNGFTVGSVERDDGLQVGATSREPPTILDPAFKRVMMFLFLATRGGDNRIKIVRLLKRDPMNANRIKEELELDYKTIQHHVQILKENKVIVSSSPEGAYGAVYFLTPYFEKHMSAIEEMWAKSGKK